jgi:ectoine hydroxylase-related dioxygenase (phytanoyl-CoA dioxygenase family)
MAQDAHLTSEQRAFFEDNGYLVIENALSREECDTYVELIDRLDRRHRDEHGLDQDAFVEIRDALSKEHGFLPLITQSTAFPLVVELMGPNIQLNTSHTMVRPPQPPDTAATFKRIDWHRDGAPDMQAVHGTMPWLYTKIGYFPTDLSEEEMGNLRVIPGSHKLADRPPIHPDAIDPVGAIEVRTNPGDAIVFQQRLWHSVGPNRSGVTRKNVYVGYCYRWVKPLDYLTPDPALLDGASPIERQLLGEPASEMTFWLPRDEELPLRAWLAEHTAASAVAGA